MSLTVLNPLKPEKRAQMAERTGLSLAEFDELADRIAGRASEVPASIARLAAASNANEMPMLSHDDQTPAQRQGFRALGVHIAEFPVTEETARDAAAASEFTVFGAPNVVRGGSHTGWTSATDMVRKGLCSILASDYLRSGDDPRRVPPCRRGCAAAAEGVGSDLGDACRRCRPHRPWRACPRPSRATSSWWTQPKLRPRIVGVIADGKLVHISETFRLASHAPARQIAAE